MQKLSTTAAAFAFCLLTVTGLCAPTQTVEVKAGVGLSGHVLKAYTEKWKYNYGSYGQLRSGVRYTDCSDLIKSYLWWTGDKTNPNPSLLSASSIGSGMPKDTESKGAINYGGWSPLPRVHGLIPYQLGHIDVYVGNNVGVDNHDVSYDMKREPVFGRARNEWTTWFKLTQLSYPTTDFVTHDGNEYYYENGEHTIETTCTIGGKIHTIGTDGIIAVSILTPEAQARQTAVLVKAAAKTTTEGAQ